MSTTLTDVEKIRRLPWLIAGDTLNIIFVTLTFAGPVFIFFLDELGLDSAQIGFLLSLIPFCGLVALLIAPLVTRLGYKRVFVTFWGIRKFVFALLLWTPAFLARFGSQPTFIWVAAIILGFAMCRAIAETGGYPWQQEVVPDAIRGKISAVSSISTTIAAIVATLGASFVVAAGTGLNRFMLLMAVGTGVGLLGVIAFSRVPAETPRPDQSTRTGHLTGMRQALRDTNFIFFLGALGLATLGSVSVTTFIPLFMREQVGLSEGTVVLLGIGNYIGSLLTSYLWGWTADRYGSKPVMQFSLALTLVLPVAWFSMPRHTPTSALLALAIALVAGAASLGWQISWLRYLFVNAMPREKKSPYTAVYYAWYGLVSGCAPLAAGHVLKLSQGLNAQLGAFAIDAYTPLFGVSLVLSAAGMLAASWLRSDRPTTFRNLVSMFWQGNPLKALLALIQYRFAGTEVTRMATAQLLGDTQNLLSARELVEALNDPSYNVRYEAINSIGRMPPEPELLDALLGVLGQTETELSSIAARSLGKLGDRRAIGPLRRAVRSGQPYLTASSARALAMLGDADSIPYFLERLEREPDGILRTAFASALGRLRARQAAPQLLALLRRAEPGAARGEIGLALARIAGDERYYLQHWHALRSDLNTAAAQAVLDMQRPARHLKLDDFKRLSEACAASFGQGDRFQAATFLKAMLESLPTQGLDETLAGILDACAQGLAETGGGHFEFILLSLHTLDTALRQHHSANTNYAG
jgi:HEAT repeat protein/Na+/melibiose symporter-like transporter